MFRTLIVRLGYLCSYVLKKTFLLCSPAVRKLWKCRGMLIRKSDFNGSEILELKVLQTGTFKSALAT